MINKLKVLISTYFFSVDNLNKILYLILFVNLSIVVFNLCPSTSSRKVLEILPSWDLQLNFKIIQIDYN